MKVLIAIGLSTGIGIYSAITMNNPMAGMVFGMLAASGLTLVLFWKQL